jgi:hypothetical protein
MNDRDIKPSEHAPGSQPAHEIRDANLRVIALCALALAVALVVIQPLLIAMFDRLKSNAQGDSPSRSPLAVGEQPLPPLLQSQPRIDLRILRQKEDQLLESYGWVDPQRDVVRIPIRRAMDLIVERGLPPTKPQPVAPTEKQGPTP